MARRKPSTVQKPTTAQPKLRVSWLLLSSVGLFILTRIYIFFFLNPPYNDVRIYLHDTFLAYDANFVPYGEKLQIEYPPLAWWAIYAPRFLEPVWLHNPPDPVQFKRVQDSYYLAFRGGMFLCDLVAFLLLLAIVKQRRPNLVGWAAITYVTITAIFGNFLYQRLDIGLTFLLLAWAFCWMKSQEHLEGVGWSTVAYTFLGFGISYKLIPAMVVPLVLLGDWNSPRRVIRLSLGLFACVAAAVLPFLIQFTISGVEVLSLFRYHSERGIQVESIWATVMMIGSFFGADLFVIFTHGAYDLAGDLSKLMVTLSSVVVFLFLALVYVWLWFRSVESHRLEAFQRHLTCCLRQ